MTDTTAARKAYTDLLKKLKPSALDAAPDDLLAQLDASHAEWHRQLGTDWSEVRGMEPTGVTVIPQDSGEWVVRFDDGMFSAKANHPEDACHHMDDAIRYSTREMAELEASILIGARAIQVAKVHCHPSLRDRIVTLLEEHNVNAEDVSSVHDNVRLIDKLMALLNERP